MNIKKIVDVKIPPTDLNMSKWQEGYDLGWKRMAETLRKLQVQLEKRYRAAQDPAVRLTIYEFRLGVANLANEIEDAIAKPWPKRGWTFEVVDGPAYLSDEGEAEE